MKILLIIIVYNIIKSVYPIRVKYNNVCAKDICNVIHSNFTNYNIAPCIDCDKIICISKNKNMIYIYDYETNLKNYKIDNLKYSLSFPMFYYNNSLHFINKTKVYTYDDNYTNYRTICTLDILLDNENIYLMNYTDYGIIIYYGNMNIKYSIFYSYITAFLNCLNVKPILNNKLKNIINK